MLWNFSYATYEQSENKGILPDKQAKILKHQRENYLDEECHIVEVISAEDFINKWNSLPNDKYSMVIVISHGTVDFNGVTKGIGSLSFYDKDKDE